MVAGKFQRTFVGAVDADFLQPRRHGARALAAPAARLAQAHLQCLVFRIKAQPHNVDGLFNEGH